MVGQHPGALDLKVRNIAMAMAVNPGGDIPSSNKPGFLDAKSRVEHAAFKLLNVALIARKMVGDNQFLTFSAHLLF